MSTRGPVTIRVCVHVHVCVLFAPLSQFRRSTWEILTKHHVGTTKESVVHCSSADHGGGDTGHPLRSSPRTHSWVAQWQSSSGWTWKVRVWKGYVSLDFGEQCGLHGVVWFYGTCIQQFLCGGCCNSSLSLEIGKLLPMKEKKVCFLFACLFLNHFAPSCAAQIVNSQGSNARISEKPQGLKEGHGLYLLLPLSLPPWTSQTQWRLSVPHIFAYYLGNDAFLPVFLHLLVLIFVLMSTQISLPLMSPVTSILGTPDWLCYQFIRSTFIASVHLLYWLVFSCCFCLFAFSF